MQTSGIMDIARGIQLAVAPVFLLSGVAGILAVLTGRLARIVDRARSLENALPGAVAPADQAIHAELKWLSRRAALVQRSITLATTCALLICLLIVSLFGGILLSRDLSLFIAVLFIAALCAFIVALIYFLLETKAATSSLRFGPGPH